MIFRFFIEVVTTVAILVFAFSIGFFAGDGTIDFYLSGGGSNYDSNFTILFGDDMAEEEIVDAKKLINKLDPRYTTEVKEIFISKNRTLMDLDSERCKKAYGPSGCGGFNDGGKITTEWDSDIRSTLCHELLHNYIISKSDKAIRIKGRWVYDDAGHAVIQHLGNLEVCFL